jgi:hypothetical protein
VLVNDKESNFFYIEVKIPSKYGHDKKNIKRQFFLLAQEEEKIIYTKLAI